jgi:preprotein translocase subunit Sec61beta
MSDQVREAEGNQPVGAGLVRFMFAETEEVGEGRQVRRPGR